MNQMYYDLFTGQVTATSAADQLTSILSASIPSNQFAELASHLTSIVNDFQGGIGISEIVGLIPGLAASIAAFFPGGTTIATIINVSWPLANLL